MAGLTSTISTQQPGFNTGYQQLSVNEDPSDKLEVASVMTASHANQSGTRKVQKLTFRNGYYQGDVLLGKRDGKGTMVEENMTTYDGDWVKDRRHGYGIATDVVTKQVYDGQWKENKRDGGCTIKAEENQAVRFSGAYKDDKPYNGTCNGLITREGTFTGQFADGVFSGTYIDLQGTKHQEGAVIVAGDSQSGCCVLL